MPKGEEAQACCKYRSVPMVFSSANHASQQGEECREDESAAGDPGGTAHGAFVSLPLYTVVEPIAHSMPD